MNALTIGGVQLCISSVGKSQSTSCWESSGISIPPQSAAKQKNYQGNYFLLNVCFTEILPRRRNSLVDLFGIFFFSAQAAALSLLILASFLCVFERVKSWLPMHAHPWGPQEHF